MNFAEGSGHKTWHTFWGQCIAGCGTPDSRILMLWGCKNLLPFACVDACLHTCNSISVFIAPKNNIKLGRAEGRFKPTSYDP